MNRVEIMRIILLYGAIHLFILSNILSFSLHSIPDIVKFFAPEQGKKSVGPQYMCYN